MKLAVERINDAVVVTPIVQRLDSLCTLDFKESMRNTISISEGTLILDLHRVEFLDSSGLGAIVAMAKVLGQDRKLELSNLNPMVQKVFKLTRMDQIFTIHVTAPTAA